MSTPNPNLVLALDERPTTYNPIKDWNDRMSYLSTQILMDRYDNRGAQYNRNAFTVAALLQVDERLRGMVLNAGHSLRAFDEICAIAQGIMLKESTKPNSGAKIANVLNKLIGQY